MTKPTARESAIELADRFRLGESLSASVELPDLLVKLASGLGPNELPLVVPVFEALLGALERKDWLGLADSLEVDLGAVLWARSSPGTGGR